MSTYNNPLKIEEIGTGEQAGTWGDTTNVNIADALPEAITGRATVTMTDADYTLPYVNSNAPQEFRNLVLNVISSGNLSATRNLIIPAINKQYIVENNTTGTPTGQSIVVKTAAGSGVTVPNGRKAHLFCDGTTTRFADDFVDINGGAIDGTPIGAASASTGAFTTASITTATVTTGNITTGNITTGNINTLLVGTQTNKATISYTTNTARTLTIPNVGGNRTFAFLDEYQLWTAVQGFQEDIVCAKNLTVEDNLVFSGAGTFGYNRILGYLAGPTINDRLFFQDGAANTASFVNVMPNGTANNSAFLAYNNSAPANSSVGGVIVDNTDTTVTSFAYGSGSILPLVLQSGGSDRVNILTDGRIGFNRQPSTNLNYDFDGKYLALRGASGGWNGAVGGNSDHFLVAVTPDTDDVHICSAGTGSNITAMRFYVANGGSIQERFRLIGAQAFMPAVYSALISGTTRDLYIKDDGELGYISSTRASKTNIAELEDTSWVFDLNPVSFNRRKQDAQKNFTDEFHDETEFGLIAEEVEQVQSTLCFYDVAEDGTKKLAGVNYTQLISPLVKAVKDLRAELETVKAELAALKG